jgi:hypothetical protein
MLSITGGTERRYGAGGEEMATSSLHLTMECLDAPAERLEQVPRRPRRSCARPRASAAPHEADHPLPYINRLFSANKRHYRWMGKTKLRREAAVFPPVRSVMLTLNSNCPLSAPIGAGGARADRGVSHRWGCDCRVHSLPRGTGRVWIEHEQRQPQLSLGVRVQGNSGDTARRKHPGGNFGRLRFSTGWHWRHLTACRGRSILPGPPTLGMVF